MRGSLAVTVACAAAAVASAASASATEAKGGGDASLVVVADWARGGVLSMTSTQKRQHRHRGRPSLVSHWLDSALGSSSSQQQEEESNFFFDSRSGSSSSSSSSSSSRSSSVRHHSHHKRGNSSSHTPRGVGGHTGDDDVGHHHKPLLPLGSRDYLGLLAASLAILLASGSGIGGGGLLVPVYLLVLGFGTRDAVALSNLTILGSSLVSLFFNLPRRHPRHADRPLIDWDIILVMEPSTICGAVLGGYLNKITPTWLTTTLLALLLTAMALKLAKRSRSAWRLEREERRLARLAAAEGREGLVRGLSGRLLLQEDEEASAAAAEEEEKEEEEETLLPGETLSSAPSLPSLVSLADEAAALAAAEAAAATRSPPKPQHSRRRRANGGGASPPKPAAAGVARGGSDERPGDDEEAATAATATAGAAAATAAAGAAAASREPPGSRFSEPRAAPPRKVALILALALFVLTADLAKQLVACGSPLYWLAVASVVPPSLAVALAARSRLVAEHALRERGDVPGWPAVGPGEVAWTAASSVVFPAVSSLAGVVAGLFGVGGGVVKGPLMLEMGVSPEVTSATSATMILFTSSAASVLYVSFGVPADYAKAVFAAGALFTALGQSLASRLVRRLGPGAVVVMMAAMMAASASVVAFEAAGLTRRAVASGSLGGHGHIC